MHKKYLNNSLIKNTSIYTLTSILNSAIPFLMLPILTRHLTPEDYGIVSMFTLLVTFIVPFIGLNLNGAITRQYYDREKINISEYAGNCIFILLINSIFVGSIFYFSSAFIARTASFPSRLLWSVLIFAVSQFICSILLSLLQVKKKALLYGIFNIIQTSLNLGISIFFVVYLGLGYTGRIYGMVITLALFALISLFILIKKKWVKFVIKKEYIKHALMFGIPLIPHVLSGTIISMTDRFFITSMVGLAATGVYTVGYQVGTIINLLSTSFNNAYVPWLYEKLKENQYTTKIKIVKFTYIYFVGILLLALGLGILAPIFLSVFLGKAFNESSVYVIWIALGYAFNGMYLMVVNYIFYEQKNSTLAMVTFATAFLNIVLNYFFIREFGAIGAAQATTIIFAIKFVVVWILSAKVHKMPWKNVLLNKN
ncbi:Polysaccharide biosynthesis protein [Aerococcus viridans]|uniref:Polysaccharide biosynthesis protein n=2 Tax=Aerococcus viridans TaxID=1377 RepID=A0AAU8U490_9LACT|nr:flippase [Aerococcus viridans]AMC01349.1 polysaccharide biosynthesis protein [Aerococcus viridans]EFG50215.1 polysaccharide biosynthesis protein [Aerococcus viridans ATCC 11563 = CCUG 4311]SUU15909.1 Polysaccharide biosynthesis protein [Aerococcus viridans]